MVADKKRLLYDYLDGCVREFLDQVLLRRAPGPALPGLHHTARRHSLARAVQPLIIIAAVACFLLLLRRGSTRSRPAASALQASVVQPRGRAASVASCAAGSERASAARSCCLAE